MREDIRVIDDWRKDGTRRAKAALIDTTVPNAARVADYIDGGRDNFEADRKAVRVMVGAAPVVAAMVPAGHAFHQRVVRYLVAEAGVRQFLDIGGGLAVSRHTHVIAQSIDPSSRIVYVHDDPMVLTHARALTKSTPRGATHFLDADVRDTDAILAGARGTLDFGQPVAVLLLSTSPLAAIADTAEATAVVSALLAGTSPGSYVALHHPAHDLHPALPAAISRWNQLSAQPLTLRSRAEIAGFVAGLEQVRPGLVPVCDWRPAPGDPSFDDVVPIHGVVARKPPERLRDW